MRPTGTLSGITRLTAIGMAALGCAPTASPSDETSRLGTKRSALELPWVVSQAVKTPPELVDVTSTGVQSMVWTGKEYIVAGYDNLDVYPLRLDATGTIAAVNETALRYPRRSDSLSLIATTGKESLLTWNVQTSFDDAVHPVARGVLVNVDGSRGEAFDFSETGRINSLATDGHKYMACAISGSETSLLLIDPAAPSVVTKHAATTCDALASNGSEYVTATTLPPNYDLEISRYDSSGVPLGTSTGSTGMVAWPAAVASDGDGFMVLLQTTTTALYAQRIAADGTFAGQMFLVGYADGSGVDGADLKYGGGNYYAAWSSTNTKYSIVSVWGVPISTSGKLLSKVVAFPANHADNFQYHGLSIAFDGSRWLLASSPGYGIFATNNGPVGQAFQIERRRADVDFDGATSTGDDYLVTWRARTTSTSTRRAARIALGTDAPTFEPIENTPTDGEWSGGSLASDGRAYVVWGESGWAASPVGKPWSVLIEGTQATPITLPRTYTPPSLSGRGVLAGAAFGGYAYAALTRQPNSEDGWAQVTVGVLDTHGQAVAAPVPLCDDGLFCVPGRIVASDTDYRLEWSMRNDYYSSINAKYYVSHIAPNGQVTTKMIAKPGAIAGADAHLAFSYGGLAFLEGPDEAQYPIQFDAASQATLAVAQWVPFEISPTEVGVVYKKQDDSTSIFLGTWSPDGALTESQIVAAYAEGYLGPRQLAMAAPGSYLLVSNRNALATLADFELRFVERGHLLGSACTASWQCVDGLCAGGKCTTDGSGGGGIGAGGAAPGEGVGGVNSGGATDPDTTGDAGGTSPSEADSSSGGDPDGAGGDADSSSGGDAATRNQVASSQRRSGNSCAMSRLPTKPSPETLGMLSAVALMLAARRRRALLKLHDLRAPIAAGQKHRIVLARQ